MGGIQRCGLEIDTHPQWTFSVTSEESLSHLTFSYWVPNRQGTGDFMRSECMKLVFVSFTLIYTHCRQLHVH